MKVGDVVLCKTVRVKTPIVIHSIGSGGSRTVCIKYLWNDHFYSCGRKVDNFNIHYNWVKPENLTVL